MADELERPGLPLVVWIAVIALVAIGLFTVVGWLVSAVWSVIRLGVLVLIVVAVVALVRSGRRG